MLNTREGGETHGLSCVQKHGCYSFSRKRIQKECKKSQNMKKENAKDLLTKAEAEAFVRNKGKSPRYCCHCDFHDALQKEAER